MGTGLEGTQREYDTAVFTAHRLDNGITVWLQEIPKGLGSEHTKEGILIAFFPRIGSRMDPLGEEGTAHFFEHIPFRGTAARPSGEALFDPVRVHGGTLGANTALERTRYGVWLPAAHFALAVETLSEMVMRPLFREEDVALERGVIAHEHRRIYRDGDEVALRHLRHELFGAHPLGHDVIGSLSVIRSMTREKLHSFHRAHYHAGNLQFICGGGFALRGGAIEELNRVFGGIVREGNRGSESKAQLPFGKRGRIVIVDPSCRRDVLIAAYPFMPPRGLNPHPYVFLAKALSSGFDSPLFVELREKRALVYEDGSCYLTNLSDIWAFGTMFATSAEDFGAVEEIYRRTLRDVESEYMLKRQRAWQYQRTTSFQSPVAACGQAVEEIVRFGRPISFREEEGKQDDLTLDEIFRVRDWLLDAEPFVLEIRGADQ